MRILLLEPNDDVRVIADLLLAEGWEATAVEDAGIIDNADLLTTLLAGKHYDCCLYCADGRPVIETTSDRLLPLANVASTDNQLRAFVLSRPGPVPVWPFFR